MNEFVDLRGRYNHCAFGRNKSNFLEGYRNGVFGGKESHFLAGTFLAGTTHNAMNTLNLEGGYKCKY